MAAGIIVSLIGAPYFILQLMKKQIERSFDYMSWTTIWSHAQRGIAHHSNGEKQVFLPLRQIAPVGTIRLVFANDYGDQVERFVICLFRQMIDDNKLVTSPLLQVK